MQARPVVSSLGHLAVRVRDVDTAVEEATNLIGLRVASRTADSVFLTHGSAHHSLVFIEGRTDALDHICFEASDAAGLKEVRERVVRAGLPIVSDSPLEAGSADGFAFVAHDGFTYEVCTGVESIEPPAPTPGVGPTRLGHVTFNVPDPEASRQRLLDLLDFRVTDFVDGLGAFLRCSVDHHTVGVLDGDGKMHHHAWEVTTIADLARLADLLQERGRQLAWGPVRHGAGHNIAAYFIDSTGAVVEMYCDMERIYNEDSFQPRTWTRDNDRWFSLWAPLRPEASEFRRYGLPPVSRSDCPAS